MPVELFRKKLDKQVGSSDAKSGPDTEIRDVATGWKNSPRVL